MDLVEGYHVMVGYDNLIFGKGISGIGGTDGILAGDGRLNVSEGSGGVKQGCGKVEGAKVDSGAEMDGVGGTE